MLFTSGCLKKSEPPEFPAMNFNIERNLLGNKVECKEFGFSFNAPVDWNEAGKKELDDASQALTKTLAGKKDISINPLYIFIRSNGCVLNIANIKLSAQQNNLKDKIKVYESVFFGDHVPPDIKKTLYSKDGINIVQYLLQENRIDFRLLFISAKGDLIQFDYLADKRNYLNEVKAIESSIGSIKLTKT